MQPEQLKIMVESGNYRPEPALIAQAMLRRRGLRALLATAGDGGRLDGDVGRADASISPADRSQGASPAHPQAA